jgi:hypothetical protein
MGPKGVSPQIIKPISAKSGMNRRISSQFLPFMVSSYSVVIFREG